MKKFQMIVTMQAVFESDAEDIDSAKEEIERDFRDDINGTKPRELALLSLVAFEKK